MSQGTASEGGSNVPPRRWKISWTSDSSGAADITTNEVISGLIVGVELVTASATRPSENYSVLIFDAGGNLIFSGTHASPSLPKRSAIPSVTLGSASEFPIAVNEPLRVVISYGGNTKSGDIIIYTK